MLSRRPYLIRAMYDWLVDSGELPHVLVEADRGDVIVPGDFVQDGRIVLNVGPDAISNLSLGNEEVSFNARFQGRPMSVSFPPEAVIAIYGRDSGQGMMFGPEDDALPGMDGDEDSGTVEARPELSTVESGDDLSSVDDSDDNQDSGNSRKRGKPDLKVIK